MTDFNYAMFLRKLTNREILNLYKLLADKNNQEIADMIIDQNGKPYSIHTVNDWSQGRRNSENLDRVRLLLIDKIIPILEQR